MAMWQINLVNITTNVQHIYIPTGNPKRPPSDVASEETRTSPSGSPCPEAETTDQPLPIGPANKESPKAETTDQFLPFGPASNERSTCGSGIASQETRTSPTGSSCPKEETTDQPLPIGPPRNETSIPCSDTTSQETRTSPGRSSSQKSKIGYVFRPDDTQCLQILSDWIDRDDFHPELVIRPDLYELHPQVVYDEMASTGNGDGCMYFLSEVEMTGRKRKTPQNKLRGFWKVSRGCEKLCRSGKFIGQKSFLEYYESSDSGKKNYVKTSWLMNEYRLPHQEGLDQSPKSTRVLALVYHKGKNKVQV